MEGHVAVHSGAPTWTRPISPPAITSEAIDVTVAGRQYRRPEARKNSPFSGRKNASSGRGRIGWEKSSASTGCVDWPYGLTAGYIKLSRGPR